MPSIASSVTRSQRWSYKKALLPCETDTETSQTTVNLVSCYTESIQPSSHLDISNQSWVKSSTREITATSASPPVTTTYVRPIKLSRLVRTMFEEASIEYASAIRTAALFPDTHFSTSTTTTTTSTTASPKLPLCSKWNYNSVNGTCRRPTQPVAPTMYATPSAPPTPLPPTWVTPRPWEQGDTIERRIQEIRCQFVPATSVTRQPPPSQKSHIYSQPTVTPRFLPTPTVTP
ncbi:salivary glue protein Sgs-3-like, partial [Homarus americanus]|uniref:salivary glue protein Sgs-3-like n=1 Tax=Homarus americanus TaxID=6706 RepID=UPI001C449DDD